MEYRATQSKMELEKTANKIFKKKFRDDQNKYNTYAIENIIFNDKTHLVALFKDYLIIDDDYEFLKRYYKREESKIRLIKYIQYYETYNFLYPNYTAIPESKFIYHNIHKKQRILDEQDRKGRMNLEKEKKYNLNGISLSSSNNTIFDSSAYHSIIQNNSNLYSTVFGIEINENNKKNDSLTEIDKIIKVININESNFYRNKDNIKDFQIGLVARNTKNKTNQNIKKSDLSPANYITNNSSNFLNAAMPNPKLKSFVSLYIKNVFKQKFAKQRNGKSKLGSDWIKNTIINNNSTKTSSNLGTQLIYQKLNPIDDTKKNKYLTVRNSKEKNKKDTNKKYFKIPFEKIDSFHNYNQSSIENKIIYVNKTSKVNSKEKLKNHNSCTNSLVPFIKKNPRRKLINSNNYRETSSNSFNSNSDEKLVYQKCLQNTLRKNINPHIYKKSITNNTKICQTLPNNNNINKNIILKELELFKSKQKKKINKLNTLKINTNNISNLSHKPHIKSAIFTDNNQSHYQKKQIPTFQNNYTNNTKNRNNKIIFMDSYSRKKVIYSSEKNKYYQSYRNNNNSNSNNIQLITPSKKFKFIMMNNKNAKNSTFIRFSKDMSSTTTRNNYSISGNSTCKKIPSLKTELMSSFKKMKNTTSNFNNRKLLSFKKFLINMSKNEAINKNYLNKNNSVIPEFPKNTNSKVYHRYHYAQTESNLNDYLDKKINKNILNGDINNRYLKTEMKRESNCNSRKDKKKRILIIENSRRTSIDTMNNTSNNCNNNTEKNIDYVSNNLNSKNDYICKTERGGNNSVKKIKNNGNKKMNQTLASLNNDCKKNKLNIKNQKLQNNEKGNVGGKKLIMNRYKYNNNRYLK